MRHDFSPAVLKEGKSLFQKGGRVQARIASYSEDQLLIEASVIGNYDDEHQCSLEIQRNESEVSYSSCDCSQGVDCHHLACLLFFLEEHFHAILLKFLGQTRSSSKSQTNANTSHLEEMEQRLHAREKKKREYQLICDYSKAGEWLSRCSLFRPPQEKIDTGELMILIGPWNSWNGRLTEIQLAVRLTGRPKPVLIQQPKAFLFSLQKLEPLILGSQRVILSDSSFGEKSAEMIAFFRREFDYHERADKVTRAAYLTEESVGSLITLAASLSANNKEQISVYMGTFETLLKFSKKEAVPSFSIELLQEPDVHIVVKPSFRLSEIQCSLKDVRLVQASTPGILFEDTYYPLPSTFSLRHSGDLAELDHYVIPEALFPSFLAYALPCLERFGAVLLPDTLEIIKKKATRVAPLAICQANIKDNELSLKLAFKYDDISLPEVKRDHTIKQIASLNSKDSYIPRDLMQETLLMQELTWGFMPDEKESRYTTRSEKRIIDFISETVPTISENVEWHISEPMRRSFLTETSTIKLFISESPTAGTARCHISIDGPLKNVDVEKVLESAKQKRSYIELGNGEQGIFTKRLLVLPSEEIEALGLLIEDFSIPSFGDEEWTVPLWSVLGVEDGQTISKQFTIFTSPKIKELKKMLIDPKGVSSKNLCPTIASLLRPYQHDGAQWLRRLREFGLGGVLADDMGLGKTLQTICALAEIHTGSGKEDPSLIVCPTSLVENWKEEINRFAPKLNVVSFVGAPGERRKLLAKTHVDLFVTSYGLIQRDLELFEKIPFSYVILDEAQAIKNRETQSARSVKKLKASHRLVLTGTPVENSLDDLWSLFDFLMPGFLGSHDRFFQTYIRPTKENNKTLEMLRKRIAPFVLRRMKKDVLNDLPPISHSIYYCALRDEQHALYQAAAKQAKKELSDLVEREGFDKARLHILTTLTRLKQICCHPSLVHHESAAPSAKYEMLIELLEGLIGNGHKTVLFSQYTKMLSIIRDDLTRRGVPYLYLDGATKQRLSLVKQFNSDETPVFLVSLRAGGKGLNLVGADSVIHYDMWWNPAVENQATDRVHRMGQTTKVSSYKLITKGTIEEKIAELQDRKKNLISDLVETDDDILSSLTWDDVLNLLKS
jgi:superfamily II DNA or RNA helicase